MIGGRAEIVGGWALGRGVSRIVNWRKARGGFDLARRGAKRLRDPLSGIRRQLVVMFSSGAHVEEGF